MRGLTAMAALAAFSSIFLLQPGAPLRPDHGSRDVSGTSSAGLSGAPVAVARSRADAPALPNTSSVGSAASSGVATWCAPTPTKCHGWGGKVRLGAVPGYGGTPYLATVCLDGGPRCVVVKVVSSCACGDRHGKTTVIDLSPFAFRQLAPQRLGVIDVTVEATGQVVLPATDTAVAP